MTVPWYQPVTAEQAARNLAILTREVEAACRKANARPRNDRGKFASSDPELQAAAAKVIQFEAAEPEPVDFSRGTGLTPRQRAALMARAKRRLIELAVAVRSENAHMVQRITARWTEAEWKAAAIAALAAADSSRLLLVVQADDDGRPAHLEGRARAA